MNAPPLVSAVIANWNGADALAVCLASLLEQNHSPIEVLVVDNGSSDNSEEVARRIGAKWMPLDGNRGLAFALNQGAAAARGDFLLFLNNDMRFHPDFVSHLLTELAVDEHRFAVDAVQYDWSGEIKVHVASLLAPCLGGAGNSVEVAPGLFINQRDTDSNVPSLMASAANMMVRRSMFEALGGFDEKLFLGYEDTDLCWRAWLRGWETVFAPSAVCWHRVGQTSRSLAGTEPRLRGTIAGRLLFAAKCLPYPYLLRAWIASLGGVAKDALALRFSRAAVRIHALWFSMHQTIPALRERTHIYRGAAIEPRQFMRWLMKMDQIGVTGN